MPGDLCTVPRTISLSLATDVTDVTFGASGLEPEQELLVAADGSMYAKKIKSAVKILYNM